MDDQQISTRARALAGAIEPFAGQVYFSPECHAGYEALGFGPSPGTFAGVAALMAQLYENARGAVGASLAAIGFAYLIRAVGDVAGNTARIAAMIAEARDEYGADIVLFPEVSSCVSWPWKDN